GTAVFTSSELSHGNVVNSDAITLGGSATVPGTNAGTYTGFATNTLTSSNANYQVTGGAVSVTISQATPTVTVTNVGAYTYNGSLQGPNTATNTGTETSYTFSYSGTGLTAYGLSQV